MRRIIISAILIALSQACLVFAQPTMKAEVNKLRISTDETLTYKLTIVSSDKQQLLPKLPEFKGFKVVSSSQSSSASFAVDKASITSAFIFVLVPTAVGKFTIEPATLSLKKETLTADSFEIEVVQGKRKVSPGERALPGPPEPQYTL